LKLTVNPGNTIDLIAGPGDFDALARLGIAAGTLSAPATGSASTSSSTSTTSSTVKATYGLGLSGTPDISTKTGADLARSQLLGVLSSIQSAYQKSNATPASATPGNTSGTASAATTAQLASYNLALSLLGTDANSAVSNIQSIVANQANGTSNGGNSLTSLLSALGG
jgi:trimeric autotransporter adhesin